MKTIKASLIKESNERNQMIYLQSWLFHLIHEIEVLNEHSPMKKKYLRANQGEFMTKGRNKAIMTRCRLRKVYRKEEGTDPKTSKFQKRHYCVNLLRRTKKNYFVNISISSITDNKKFWKTVKLIFSDKSLVREQLT